MQGFLFVYSNLYLYPRYELIMKNFIKVLAIVLILVFFNQNAEASIKNKQIQAMSHHNDSHQESYHCEQPECPNDCEDCLNFCLRHNNCFSHEQHIETSCMEFTLNRSSFIKNEAIDKKIKNRASQGPEPPPPKN